MEFIITESQLSKILTEQTTISGKSSNNVTRVGPFCKSKWTSYLKQAKDYWIQWLSSPITKSKFKKNWGVGVDNKIDGITVDDLFKKYINAINAINLVYYDNVTASSNSTKNTFAYVIDTQPTKLFVNCSKNDEQPLTTLVHEIQHTLYKIKPLNPSVKIGDVFVKDGTKKMTPKDFEVSYEALSKFWVNIRKVSKKYGINEFTLFTWLRTAKSQEKNNPNYACKETEKMSNIMAIRKLFNLKPGENITKEMLIPYIKKEKYDGQIYWVLCCWALSGYQDINIMINKINQLAYQDTKQNNDTQIA